MISEDQDQGRWESLTYLIDDRLLEEIKTGRVVTFFIDFTRLYVTSFTHYSSRKIVLKINDYHFKCT